MLAGCVPGSTLGSRTVAFGLRQSAWTEFGTTLFLVAYLFFLRCFNTRRATQVQEHTVTAADFTVFVTGLSACGLRSSEDVASKSASTSTLNLTLTFTLSGPRRDQP